MSNNQSFCESEVRESFIESGVGESLACLSGKVLYHCNFNPGNVYEINRFFPHEVIRFAIAPGGDPDGVGGTDLTLWHCDSNANNGFGEVYELSLTDFAFGQVIRSAIPPGSGAGGGGEGVGGDDTTIWYSEDKLLNDVPPPFGKIHELSSGSSSFASAIRSVDASGTRPSGVGGTVSSLWFIEDSTDTFNEMNVSQFSINRSIPFGSPLNQDGLGGNGDEIFHTQEFPPEAIWSVRDTLVLALIETHNLPLGNKSYGLGGK